MLCCFSARAELSCEWLYAAGSVWRVATRDNQTDVASSTLGKVGGETIMFVAVFEAGVHGAHEHAVLQGGEPEIQWCEKMWIISVGQCLSFKAVPLSDPAISYCLPVLALRAARKS
jgi:hypothetical protein